MRITPCTGLGGIFGGTVAQGRGTHFHWHRRQLGEIQNDLPATAETPDSRLNYQQKTLLWQHISYLKFGVRNFLG